MKYIKFCSLVQISICRATATERFHLLCTFMKRCYQRPSRSLSPRGIEAERTYVFAVTSKRDRSITVEGSRRHGDLGIDVAGDDPRWRDRTRVSPLTLVRRSRATVLINCTSISACLRGSHPSDSNRGSKAIRFVRPAVVWWLWYTYTKTRSCSTMTYARTWIWMETMALDNLRTAEI